MSTRYVIPKPLSRERLNRFVCLGNLTAQVPLIEIRPSSVRIWTAYDYERIKGTYTEIFRDGQVVTVTVYPGGLNDTKLVRERDDRGKKRQRKRQVRAAKGKPKRARVADRLRGRRGLDTQKPGRTV